MKKLLILVILVLSASLIFGEQDSTKTDTVLTAKEICAKRGHIIIEFQIYRENVKPEFQDYADSTVMYYYDDNKQTGTMAWCKRCKNWIGVPQLDTPKTKTIWRKKYE